MLCLNKPRLICILKKYIYFSCTLGVKHVHMVLNMCRWTNKSPI